jgi:hypothetical protein
VELGIAAGVKKLLLFHHDPGRKDAQVLAIKERCEEHARARGASIAIDAATEDSEIVL